MWHDNSEYGKGAREQRLIRSIEHRNAKITELQNMVAELTLSSNRMADRYNRLLEMHKRVLSVMTAEQLVTVLLPDVE